MFWLYIVIIIVSSIFLTILCLLQSSKKENSSGGIIETSDFSRIVGVKNTSDILEKMTLFFSFILFFMSILTYTTLTSDRRKEVKVGQLYDVNYNKNVNTYNET